MNYKKNITPIVLVLLMTIPFFGFSQSINKRSEANIVENKKERIWKPINIFPDHNNIMQSHANDVGTPVLTNIKNGVSFYRKPCDSNTERVVLLKIENSNDYPVQISWQINPKSPKISVSVKAKSESEGICSAKDGNASKLTIHIPLDDDVEKIKKYIVSQLSVTK